MLHRSLESAPFTRSDAEHIAVLYYVAECALFWLRLRLEAESTTHREQETSGPSSRRLDPSDLKILTVSFSFLQVQMHYTLPWIIFCRSRNLFCSDCIVLGACTQ